MKSIMVSLRQHEEQHRADGNKHDQREHEILLDTTGLNSAQFTARPIGGIGRAIAKETINDWQVKIVAYRVAKPLCARTEEVQDAINHAQIHELVNDILCKPV